MPRPPLPPFTAETAAQKVRAAEDAWNGRDAEKVALAYTADSRWRNRSQFLRGREEIVRFLAGRSSREPEHRLVKQLWAFTEAERLFRWDRSAPHPSDRPDLTEPGL